MILNAIKESPMPYMTSSGFHAATAKKYRVDSELPAISETIANNTEENRLLAILTAPSGTQKLHHYLEAAIKTRDVEAKTATMAMKVWRVMSTLSSNKLPVPDAGVCPDGQLLYTWSKSEHHFELEIFPSGLGEFFYLNRLTDEMWDCEYNIGDSIPDEAKEKLNLFSL